VLFFNSAGFDCGRDEKRLSLPHVTTAAAGAERSAFFCELQPAAIAKEARACRFQDSGPGDICATRFGMRSAGEFNSFSWCYTVRAQTGIEDMNLNKDAPLRGMADTTERVPAPVAKDSEMKIYRLSAESIDRKVWKRGVVAMASLVAIEVAFTLIKGQSADPDQRMRMVVAGLFATVAAAAAIVFASRKLRESLSTYRLTVTSDSIVRTQDGLRILQLDRAEITSLGEAKGRGLYIGGQERLCRIFIPTGLVDYDEVRRSISEWGTPKRLTILSLAKTRARDLGLVLGILAAWGICAGSFSPIVAVPCAAAFYGLVGLAVSDTYKDPNESKRAKISTSLCLLMLWHYLALPYLRVLSAIFR
jgi:hypothetical protein